MGCAVIRIDEGNGPYKASHPGYAFVRMCGDVVDKTWACSRCSRLATRLCDYPMGNGRTCDAPLCDECASSPYEIGADIDFCPTHARTVGPRPRTTERAVEVVTNEAAGQLTLF